MLDSQCAAHFLLSRLPRIGEVEAEVCRVEGERKERRTAAQGQAKGEEVMIYKRGGWHWTDFTENLYGQSK